MKFEGINDDDVVISGIGFKVPESGNLADFTEKLLQGINLVTKDEKKLSPGKKKLFFIINMANFGLLNYTSAAGKGANSLTRLE